MSVVDETPFDTVDSVDLEEQYSEEALAEMFAPPRTTLKRIWHPGPTYRHVGDPKPVGSLGAGLRPFNGQRNYPRNRVQFRQYWNVWWMQAARDDQGNTHVWISAVFCAEGANGRAVPNLNKT